MVGSASMSASVAPVMRFQALRARMVRPTPVASRKEASLPVGPLVVSAALPVQAGTTIRVPWYSTCSSPMTYCPPPLMAIGNTASQASS